VIRPRRSTIATPSDWRVLRSKFTESPSFHLIEKPASPAATVTIEFSVTERPWLLRRSSPLEKT
jgi:hypothetical protein